MLTVFVTVDRAEAIRRGVAAQGKEIVRLSAEWLATLSEKEREQLAKTSPEERVGGGGGLYVPEPTPKGVLEALQSCIARETREAQEKAERDARLAESFAKNAAERLKAARDHVEQGKALVVDDRYPPYHAIHSVIRDAGQAWDGARGSYTDANQNDPWYTEIMARAHAELREKIAQSKQEAAERDKREEERKARREAAWSVFEKELIEGAEESVRERHEAGVLPKEELRDLARKRLFAAFAENEITVYTKIRASDISHDEDNCDYPQIEHEIDTLEEMDAETFAAWKKISEIAKEIGKLPYAELVCEVSPCLHTAKCPSCDAEVTRYSAFVEISLGTEAFSRRYDL